MSDIDALIERLKNTSEDLFYATPCTAKLMCEQAAAALERMRDENKDLDNKLTAQFCMRLSAEAEVARLREALREVLELSLNPAGMTPEILYDDGKFANFIAENKRKCEAAIANARAALAQGEKLGTGGISASRGRSDTHRGGAGR